MTHPTQMTALCSTPGCDEDVSAKGLCGKHYKRKWRGAPKKKSRAGNTTNHERMAGRLSGVSQLPDDLKEAYGFSFNGNSNK